MRHELRRDDRLTPTCRYRRRWLRGFHAARKLGRLARGKLDIILINPTDYFLYLPLLPEVTAGILDPRTVAAPLTSIVAECASSLAPSLASTLTPGM